MGASQGSCVANYILIKPHDNIAIAIDLGQSCSRIEQRGGVSPINVPIKANFFHGALLHLDELGFDFHLLAGIFVELGQQPSQFVQISARVRCDDLKAVEHELVSLLLVEFDSCID